MAENFNLPKELRLIIFEHVFTTPQGIVGLVPQPLLCVPRKIIAKRADKVEYVSLSILRTCKRFYWDCKDLLWKLNTFDLEPILSQSLPATDVLDLDASVWNNIRSVELGIGFSGDPSNVSRASWLQVFLKQMGSWNNLASISFIVRGGFSDCVKAMNGLWQVRRGLPSPHGTTMEKCLGFLKSAGTEGGYLSHLKRKIVFSLDYERPSERDWTSPTSPLNSEQKPIADSIFMELATSFGGDIIVNGEVCYSNRIQKKTLFYTYLHSENHYTQLVSLKKDCVLQKLGFIYAKWTRWDKDQVRDHLLGRRTLRVSAEEMESVRENLKEWLKRVPKQLAKLTKEMIEERPFEVEEQLESRGLVLINDSLEQLISSPFFTFNG